MSYDLVKEDVPSFVKRIGDRVIEGSNNSIIILGTDRAAQGDADLASGLGSISSAGGGKGAGSIHMIAGRVGENPNFQEDKAYMYLSMNTDADDNMQTTNIPGKHGVITNGVSAALIKADAMRVVCRKNIKFVVGKSSILITENEIVIDSPSLRFGAGSNLNEMDRSELMKQLILTHIHLTPVGPTSIATPDPNIVKTQSGQLNIKHT